MERSLYSEKFTSIQKHVICLTETLLQISTFIALYPCTYISKNRRYCIWLYTKYFVSIPLIFYSSFCLYILWLLFFGSLSVNICFVAILSYAESAFTPFPCVFCFSEFFSSYCIPCSILVVHISIVHLNQKIGAMNFIFIQHTLPTKKQNKTVFRNIFPIEMFKDLFNSYKKMF